MSCVINFILFSSYFSYLTGFEKYDKFPNTGMHARIYLCMKMYMLNYIYHEINTNLCSHIYIYWIINTINLHIAIYHEKRER
jgi:hypothetical protein